MPLTPTIIENVDARGKKRLTYKLVNGSVTYGPFIEFRPSAEDHNAWAAAKATAKELELASEEILANIAKALSGPFVAPTFVWSTAVQFRAALREVFKTARAYVVCRLAWYIQRLGLTDAQLKAMFGVNDTQLVTLKTKLASWEQKYLDVEDEVGE